nr:N-acetylneuraminate synthase [Campylobacter concisus]
MGKEWGGVGAGGGANEGRFERCRARKRVSRNGREGSGQGRAADKSEREIEMIKELELGEVTNEGRIEDCERENITFLSTPFDSDSIKLLDELGLSTFKIPSGEITNLPYLRQIGGLNKKIILSTGMANLGEVESAIEVLIKSGTKRENISLLHANTQYPTPMEDVNLKAMITLKNAFGLEVGYSDHTLGIEVDIAAVAMGAKIIEKHFTLDKSMPGPDHKASLEPDELADMIRAIRNIELALGDGLKHFSKSESENIKIARKSIVAKCDIKKGEIFSEKNICVKRPGDGINPMRWDEVIGQISQKDYKQDDLI